MIRISASMFAKELAPGIAVRDFRTGLYSVLRQIKRGTQKAQWDIGSWTFRVERTVSNLWVWTATSRVKLNAKHSLAVDAILFDAEVQGLQMEDNPVWVGEISRASLTTVDPDDYRGQYA